MEYVFQVCFLLLFFFTQKTAYEMRISDWSSDVCSSDLLHNVKHALVGADLELLARLLVDVRATVDRELFDARRKGNRTADKGAGAAGGVGDVAGRLIEHAMIERLEANADVAVHCSCTDAKEPKTPDRTSVVKGKSGAVRGDLGGRRT